ncbi:hypothetical protein D9757_010162 [Collybiopsis confluens]|uniref:Uncharacterized protein n=1 Tax=Collybiopsis confluens TaxID=2823264 RepID=A0A8H5H0Q5_9AGAR|nr:hypothetical protein D9757_010162 [Collybiopsis confluens]
MSDVDSDSSELPSEIPTRTIARGLSSKTKTSSSKQKSKFKEKAKGEERDPTWAFRPPEGMSIVQDVENEDNDNEWDWDAFNQNEELELWLIRVPNGIKPKHLENLSIDLPPSKSRPKSSKVGVLNRKTEDYDVWTVNLHNSNVASSSSSADRIIGGVEVSGDAGDNAGAGVIGGEEMKGLTCLLPRRKKKKKSGEAEFFIAPRPITRHLVLTAQPPKPSLSSSPSPDKDSSISIPTQNPPRFSYPKEMLKHRFVAFGSTEAAAGGGADGVKEGPEIRRNEGDGDGDKQMDVDPPASPVKKEKEKSTKESRKRKTTAVGEGDAPLPKAKKQKKVKK